MWMGDGTDSSKRPFFTMTWQDTVHKHHCNTQRTAATPGRYEASNEVKQQL